MYTKLLIPLDGSRLAEGVLPYARLLAHGLNVPVELLRVNDPAESGSYLAPIHRDEYFEKIAASFSIPTNVTHRVEAGNPATAIVRLGAAQPGALIMMVKHGERGLQRWLLGSIAENVLHKATNDLLLVQPSDESSSGEARLNSAFVPLDGSELAEQVFSTVTELATRLQLEICLMHVVIRVYFGPPEGFLPVFSGNIPNQKQLWAEAGAQATDYLTRKVEQLRAQGVPRVSSVLIEGSAEGAAAEIIDRGSKTSNALVVMSTHGRSGIGRWLIGSVTERVVRHSLHPVLVTRSHPNGLGRFL